MDPGKLTPEAFAAHIAASAAQAVTQSVMAGVREILNNKPVQEHKVLRQTPTGPVTQQTSLTQMIAELTDVIKIQNDMMRYQMALGQQVGQEMQALRMELEEHRKMAQKISKKGKRKTVDDDEDDD